MVGVGRIKDASLTGRDAFFGISTAPAPATLPDNPVVEQQADETDQIAAPMPAAPVAERWGSRR